MLFFVKNKKSRNIINPLNVVYYIVSNLLSPSSSYARWRQVNILCEFWTHSTE